MKPLDLLNQVCTFESTYDVYVMLGVARKKDNIGITNSQEVVFRQVVKDKSNIVKKYQKLLAQCEGYRNHNEEKLNFYMYISCNGRDVRKGLLTFKKKLLTYEESMMLGVDCTNQLKRVDSLWISAIMQPSSRSMVQKRFMLDIDTKSTKVLNEIIYKIVSMVNTAYSIIQETKNGYHMLTEPFNKKEFTDWLIKVGHDEVCEVNSDALILVQYISKEDEE